MFLSFPGGSVIKNPPANALSSRRQGFNSWVRKIPWRRAWQPAPIFLPGECLGQRSLAATVHMTEVTQHACCNVL